MSRDQLAAVVNGLGNLLDVLGSAAPEDKAEVYRRLGLRLTYDAARRVVIAESDPWKGATGREPTSPSEPPDRVGKSKCRRGDFNPHYTCALARSLLHSVSPTGGFSGGMKAAVRSGRG
jgi:hypothetical protein